jgi:hypothetical protein
MNTLTEPSPKLPRDRGAPLSMVSMRNDPLVCKYHGFQYDHIRADKSSITCRQCLAKMGLGRSFTS